MASVPKNQQYILPIFFSRVDKENYRSVMWRRQCAFMMISLVHNILAIIILMDEKKPPWNVPVVMS